MELLIGIFGAKILEYQILKRVTITLKELGINKVQYIIFVAEIDIIKRRESPTPMVKPIIAKLQASTFSSLFVIQGVSNKGNLSLECFDAFFI